MNTRVNARSIYVDTLTKEILKKIDVYIDDDITEEEKKDLHKRIEVIINRETIWPDRSRTNRT